MSRPASSWIGEGIQCYYQPDIGTWAQPLPTNSLTGQPFLCLTHGALMECAYFCATYHQQHPDWKAQVVPGEPVLAAFQKDDKLGIFIPSLGVFKPPEGSIWRRWETRTTWARSATSSWRCRPRPGRSSIRSPKE